MFAGNLLVQFLILLIILYLFKLLKDILVLSEMNSTVLKMYI